MLDGGKLIIKTENVILNEEFCRIHPDANPWMYALLTVADNGHGIDKETLDHIFEPFYTTKEVGKGMGLGLSILYGIVKEYGGEIEVESEPGKGTSFKQIFPVAVSEAING
jgi:signal transduction histidine kinase